MNDPNPLPHHAAAEPVNPYAPPVTMPKALRRTKRRSAAVWLYAFIGVQVVALILDFAALVEMVDSIIAVLVRGLVGGLIGLRWLEKQWERLPERRRTVKERHITPWEAAWRNVIPFYNWYWMFAVNLALCLHIEAMLAKKGRPAVSPSLLAVICPITVVLGGFGWGIIGIVPGVLWVVYMLRVERALTLAKAKVESA